MTVLSLGESCHGSQSGSLEPVPPASLLWLECAAVADVTALSHFCLVSLFLLSTLLFFYGLRIAEIQRICPLT